MEPSQILKNYPGNKCVFNDYLSIMNIDNLAICGKIKNNIEQNYDRKICKIIIEIIPQIDILLKVINDKQSNIVKHDLVYNYKNFLKRKEHAKQLHFECNYIQAFDEYYKLLKDLIFYIEYNTIDENI